MFLRLEYVLNSFIISFPIHINIGLLKQAEFVSVLFYFLNNVLRLYLTFYKVKKLCGLFYNWLIEVILARECIVRLFIRCNYSRAKVTGNSKFFPLTFLKFKGKRQISNNAPSNYFLWHLPSWNGIKYCLWKKQIPFRKFRSRVYALICTTCERSEKME